MHIFLFSNICLCLHLLNKRALMFSSLVSHASSLLLLLNCCILLNPKTQRTQFWNYIFPRTGLFFKYRHRHWPLINTYQLTATWLMLIIFGEPPVQTGFFSQSQWLKHQKSEHNRCKNYPDQQQLRGVLMLNFQTLSVFLCSYAQTSLCPMKAPVIWAVTEPIVQHHTCKVSSGET